MPKVRFTRVALATTITVLVAAITWNEVIDHDALYSRDTREASLRSMRIELMRKELTSQTPQPHLHSRP